MSVWTILWVMWIAMFFLIEIPAIRNDIEGDTLSENLANWFSVDTRRGRIVWTVVWGIFGAWMVTHILVTGGAFE